MDRKSYREQLIARIIDNEARRIRDLLMENNYNEISCMIRNGLTGLDYLSTHLLEKKAKDLGLVN